MRRAVTKRNERRARQGPSHGLLQVLFIVTDDRLHDNGNTDGVELIGQIQRIRILKSRCEHFRTDRDNLRGKIHFF